MSLQCITPTIGLVADQTPDHFVLVSIISLHSYGCHPSYDHWIIVTTTTDTTTTTTTTIKLRKDLFMDVWPNHNIETEKASEDQEDSTTS